jgi:HK97 family phage major capsid protein
MSKVKELREKRAGIHAQVVELLKTEQTAETRAKVAAMFADIDALGNDIANIERSEKLEKDLAESTKGTEIRGGKPASSSEKSIEERAKAYRAAWGKALRKQPNFRSGSTGVGDAKWCAINELDEETRNVLTAESRDVNEGSIISQIGTYSGLGFFVPAGFVYDVEVALKYYAPLIDGKVVDVLETATGQPLPYPTNNDTTNEATVVGESVQVSEQDVTANHINLGAWKYTTGLVRVSLELLQDSAFNLESFLADRFAVRLGRGYERDFTNGTGINQPTGIITDVLASGATPVIANGSSESTGGSETGANSIGYTDLVRLEHSIDPSYRRGAKFMLHDQTLSKLKQILDRFGRPLWTPGVKDGAPDTLLGYQYVINQHVPQIAASANTVIFGDLKKFLIRKVKDLTVLRLDERFADFGQVAFVGFARVDSRLIDAGTHPVNLLQQHS